MRSCRPSYCRTFIAFFFIFVVELLPHVDAIVVNGYIADRLSVDRIFSTDGTNMIYRPFDHRLNTMLQPANIASGFLLLIPQDFSQLGYRLPLYNLTEPAAAVALAFLWSLPPSRRNINVLADLTPSSALPGQFDITPGTLLWDLGAGETTNMWSGFAVDEKSLVASTLGSSTVDMRSSPQRFPAASLQDAIASGDSSLLIMLPVRPDSQGNTALGFGAVYRLSTKSVAIISSWVQALPPSRDNLRVRSWGRYSLTSRELTFSDITGDSSGAGAITFVDEGKGAVSAAAPICVLVAAMLAALIAATM